MSDELKNGIKITTVVILIISVVYLITAIFMTGEIGNKNSNKSTKNESVSSYTSYNNMILASNTFNQKESEYMVMFILKDELKDALKSKITSYVNTSDKLKLYVVSMDDAVNKYVYSKEDNSNASSYEELKMSKNTLLIIKDGKIDSYITDNDELLEKLSN